MKKVVHPDYVRLEPQFLEIVKGNYTPDVVFCNNRNVVEKVTVAGEEFVVKRYKLTTLFNRFVYRLFRKSKARRAYEYAGKLLKCGIDTPFPVAYFEEYKYGLFRRGYFISKYVPYKLLKDVYDEPEDVRIAILHHFVDFMRSVHEKGVMPMDMNAGNVFYYYSQEEGRFKFSLTDINRMRFGVKPNFIDMAFSFEQCFIELERLFQIINIYSGRTGVNPWEMMYHVMRFRVKRHKRNILKKDMAARIGKKK